MIFSKEISGGYKEEDNYTLLSGDSISYFEMLNGFKFKINRIHLLTSFMIII